MGRDGAADRVVCLSVGDTRMMRAWYSQTVWVLGHECVQLQSGSPACSVWFAIIRSP